MDCMTWLYCMDLNDYKCTRNGIQCVKGMYCGNYERNNYFNAKENNGIDLYLETEWDVGQLD